MNTSKTNNPILARGTEIAAQAAEDISLASRRLAENAEQLTTLIAQFKL
jgi:methyl-accepting chemotaxis protein